MKTLSITESWREFRNVWQALPPPEQKRLVANLPSEEFDAINWWLVDEARDKQIIPAGDWFTWLLRSGRGFGKTRTGAETVQQWVRDGYKRIALIGQTKADVRDTMVEVGDSSLMKITTPELRPAYEPSKRRVTFPNGAMCIIYSGDEPDQLRGPQHEKAWVDELAKFKYPQETWDNLEFGLRIGDKPQVVVTTTPRPIKIIKDILADPRTINTVGSSYENEENLSPIFIERVIRKYEGTHLGKQEIHGQIMEDVPGALWNRNMIEAGRVNVFSRLFRVGVGVDPHATSGETGIIVAGIARIDNVIHGYILEDSTMGGKPEQWGSAVVAGYNRHDADIIVGEINNGGDMIENTIRNVDGGRTVNYKTVRASRGKYTRAEPISALYGNPTNDPPIPSRVHHVGFFPELEDQMCSYIPGNDSPNNMDAAVWILTELMLDASEKLPKQQPKQKAKYEKDGGGWSRKY